jgi:6-pyruvoyltetrahydropterin/6-carboxytetrahydropterin synthase
VANIVTAKGATTPERVQTWHLRKTVRFEAAHHLPSHDGKCARVHGHSWEAVVEVSGPALQTHGPRVDMLVDYADLSGAVDPLVDVYLDHYDLNETTGLENPTSEALARWLFDRLVDRLPNLTAVTIRETCTSECRYARH